MNTPLPLHRQAIGTARARLDAMRIVLVRPSHPGNVGSAARAMLAMGLRDLCVVDAAMRDWSSEPAAVSLASGAQWLLRRTRSVATLADALADCERVVGVSAESRDLAPKPLPPEPVVDAVVGEIDSMRVNRAAYVFGTERTGLTIEQLALCQQLISIPADPMHSSLNLAQAVQVIAYVIRTRVVADDASGLDGHGAAQYCGPPRPLHPERGLASHASVEGLHAHARRSLQDIGFLDPAHPKKLLARLRRLFARTDLERAEVDLLRGVCTQIDKLVRERDVLRRLRGRSPTHD